MKNMKYIVTALLLALSLTGCIDRDIIDAKTGISLPPVENLKASMADGKEITLEWNLPANIPAEVQRPLSVYVQVYRGTTLEYQISLKDEPATWNYTLAEPENKYRVVVKMQGSLKEQIYGESNEIYSLGETVAVN